MNFDQLREDTKHEAEDLIRLLREELAAFFAKRDELNRGVDALQQRVDGLNNATQVQKKVIFFYRNSQLKAQKADPEQNGNEHKESGNNLEITNELILDLPIPVIGQIEELSNALSSASIRLTTNQTNLRSYQSPISAASFEQQIAEFEQMIAALQETNFSQQLIIICEKIFHLISLFALLNRKNPTREKLIATCQVFFDSIKDSYELLSTPQDLSLTARIYLHFIIPLKLSMLKMLPPIDTTNEDRLQKSPSFIVNPIVQTYIFSALQEVKDANAWVLQLINSLEALLLDDNYRLFSRTIEEALTDIYEHVRTFKGPEIIRDTRAYVGLVCPTIHDLNDRAHNNFVELHMSPIKLRVPTYPIPFALKQMIQRIQPSDIILFAKLIFFARLSSLFNFACEHAVTSSMILADLDLYVSEAQAAGELELFESIKKQSSAQKAVLAEKERAQLCEDIASICKDGLHMHYATLRRTLTYLPAEHNGDPKIYAEYQNVASILLKLKSYLVVDILRADNTSTQNKLGAIAQQLMQAYLDNCPDYAEAARRTFYLLKQALLRGGVHSNDTLAFYLCVDKTMHFLTETKNELPRELLHIVANIISEMLNDSGQFDFITAYIKLRNLTVSHKHAAKPINLFIEELTKLCIESHYFPCETAAKIKEIQTKPLPLDTSQILALLGAFSPKGPANSEVQCEGGFDLSTAIPKGTPENQPQQSETDSNNPPSPLLRSHI